ncbi:MAG: divalent-cation tolerance protein CutA [Gammaproteobacteria bacterium]
MTDGEDYLLVLSTCPDNAVASRLATRLVEQRAAACVKILPAVHSIYRWADKLESNAEVLLLIKTRRWRYAEVETLLRLEHPYELPEIIAVPIVQGSSEYLSWINEMVNAAP